MPLPGDLVDAIAAALQREAEEPDVEKRENLLGAVRAAVDGWNRGRLSTQEAIVLLRTAVLPD